MLPDQRLRPILLVSYQRKYYQNAHGVRTTWDENIRYRRLNTQMLAYGPVYRDELGVFEVKADATIPKDVLLDQVPLNHERFSKYCRGIEHSGLFIGF
ncbi:MAG: VTC domain-containing protein [Bdellovibrionota bacterium]